MTDARTPLDAAADAAVNLAAERPWRDVALREIAAASGFPMTAFYGVARSKDDVVDAVFAGLDKATAEGLEIDAAAPVRERVFDAAMARFDMMERRRAGVSSILKGEIASALGAARMLPRAVRTARWLLELAGVDTSGAAGVARTQGFAIVLARTTRAWLDDAGDLSRTMATLDRALRDIETWSGRFAGRTKSASKASSASGDGSI